MRRNSFGQIVPKDYTEMLRSLEEARFKGSECLAEISFITADNEFKGWSAEVYDQEHESLVFTTQGYEHKDALLRDLKFLEITKVEELACV